MNFTNWAYAIRSAIVNLQQRGVNVDTGHWQGVSTKGHPDLMTREILDLRISAPMPYDQAEAVKVILPNMPWAEDHFLERVSRNPSNPGEEYKNWPWWKGQKQADKTLTESVGSRDFDNPHVFTHTYQERFWPKRAGEHGHTDAPNYGIRYFYGDLDDVVSLLFKEPNTRQAYFPIFFPEDTGAVHGGRIPCTLGYHFLRRGNSLHCWYDIRSCDAVRHFRDDIYLAVRLVQWVIWELIDRELRSDAPQLWIDVNPGMLHFSAHSFHVHKGDEHLL